MKVTVLPQDLQIETFSKIQVYNYRRREDVEKLKITLSRNTISFLREGVKEVIGDNKSVRLEPNEFVLMKSGKCLMSEKVSNKDGVYHSVLLFFTDELVLDFLKRNLVSLQRTETFQSFYTFRYDQFLEHFVQSLEKIMHWDNANNEKLLKAKFDELMHYLSIEYGSEFLLGLIHERDDKTLRLKRVVENNLYNKLSIQELAFLAYMSVSSFKRAFHKTYDKTPMKYFQEKRMEHAAMLLKSQRFKPIEVYEDAGYENFSNFIQAFKKRFGMTPKQYQNQ